MRKSLILLSILLLVAASAGAQVPYGLYGDDSPTPNPAGSYSIGNIPDGTTTYPSRVGVPTTPIVSLFFDAPATADADYFLNDGDAATTGTLYPTTNANQKNASTGMPFSRNFTITASAATTGTLTLTYVDVQGRTRVSAAIEFDDDETAATAFTGTKLLSINITTAFPAETTIDVGFGNIFGVPYPMYTNTVLFDKFDTDGVGFPNTDTTTTIVPGDPASTTADAFGTLAFSDAPDGTNDYYVVYIATFWWLPQTTNPKSYPITTWSLR